MCANPARRKREARPSRRVKTTLHITCEGEVSERWYFDGLKRLDEVAQRFAIEVKKGAGGTRLEIAQSAVDAKERAREPHDFYWCVFDVERQSHRTSLQKAMALLRTNGIVPCLSNPSFEVWLLAHFRRTRQEFENSDAVENELNRHWKKEFGCEYEKSDKKVFTRLEGQLDQAVNNAIDMRMEHEVDPIHAKKKSPHGWLCTSACNSSTDIGELVKWLLEGGNEELPDRLRAG